MRIPGGVLRAIARTRSDDGGWALVAVMGLMSVLLLLMVTLSAGLIGAMGRTSMSEASVQSQGAADAGLAAGRVMLSKGTCASSGGQLTGTDPDYRVTTWISGDGTNYSRGCPSSATKFVRLIASGGAETPGLASMSGGDSRYMEMTFAYEKQSAAKQALYVAGSTQLNSMQVISGTTDKADIYIENGDWTCTSSGVYAGNVIVPNGKVTFSNNCTVQGDVYAKKGIFISAGANILGDLVSAAGNIEIYTPATIKGSVYAAGDFLTSSGGTIEGSVEATANATISANTTIKGNLTAKWVKEIRGHVLGNVQSAQTGVKTLITPGSSSDVRVAGSLRIGGTLDSWNLLPNLLKCITLNITDLVSCTLKVAGAVLGPISINVTGLVGPVLHVYAYVGIGGDWKSFQYDKAEWQAAGWTRELVWPASKGCQIDNYNGTNSGSSLYAFWQSVLNSATPTVIDARGCTTLNFSSSAALQLKLKTDLAIIGNGIKLEAVNVTSADGLKHAFHLLSPNGNPLGLRVCLNVNAKIELNSAVKIDAKITGLLYTPCQWNVSGPSQWNGQVYVGEVAVSSGDRLVYSQVNIPGTTFEDVTSSTGATMSVVSVRNRSDDGE